MAEFDNILPEESISGGEFIEWLLSALTSQGLSEELLNSINATKAKIISAVEVLLYEATKAASGEKSMQLAMKCSVLTNCAEHYYRHLTSNPSLPLPVIT